MEKNRAKPLEKSGARYALAVLFGSVAGFVAVLLILALFALVIVKSGSFGALYKAALCTALLTGGLLSGFVASKAAGRNGLLTGLLSALLCLLLVWLVALLPGGGVSPYAVLPGVLCAAGGLAGGIAGVNIGK